MLAHLALMHSPVNGTNNELAGKIGMPFDTAACSKELFEEPKSPGSGRGPECHPPTESSDKVGASPHGDLPVDLRLSH